MIWSTRTLDMRDVIVALEVAEALPKQRLGTCFLLSETQRQDMSSWSIRSAPSDCVSNGCCDRIR